ncbi:hypothetical protein O6H91_02G024000 [Diphasiastrum complanatum]|uniref:Uncharacterized protein n=1 Tax=Diphasiastrum complanatum TaxID=34168 RepID=A0ACC2EDY8_DIPCM|nr:hypothetical protein O6H91_02G024000 [Diphasiastrum complanatum]
MAGNQAATIFLSNLDEKVHERLLYEVMVQAGPLVKVYIPQDKETKQNKGYGFAEYETEESAEYALKLFSGLVSFHNRPVKFSISASEKPAQTLENWKAIPNRLPSPPVHALVPINKTWNSSNGPCSIPLHSIVPGEQNMRNSLPNRATHPIFPAKENAEGLLKRCQTVHDMTVKTQQPPQSPFFPTQDKFSSTGPLHRPGAICLPNFFTHEQSIEEKLNRSSSILAHSLSPINTALLYAAGTHNILDHPIFPQKLVFSPHGRAHLTGHAGSSFPLQGHNLRTTAFIQDGAAHLTPIGQRGIQAHTLNPGYHHLHQSY